MRKVIPKGIKLIPDNARLVHKGVIFDVYQWDQEQFDGSMALFERIKRTDTVLAICIVDGKIVLQEDEQPHRGVKIKFPGGRIDPEDDSTLTAVKREVLEETGYQFADWQLIEVAKPQDKIDWFVYIYVAKNVTSKSKVEDDPGERLTNTLKDLDFIKEMIDNDTTGFLSSSRHLFKNISSIEDLGNLPEFEGEIVDR